MTSFGSSRFYSKASAFVIIEEAGRQTMLTIVTATLNAERTVARTIDSVSQLRALWPWLEHIFVDGGSGDQTLQIIRQMRAAGDQIVVDESLGISRAFNLGLAKARGDYVLILNADDYVVPDALAETLAIADRRSREAPPPEIFYGNVLLLSERGGSVEERVADLAPIGDYMSVYHPAMLVARVVYERLGGYNPSYKLAMDSEFVHRCVASGVRFEHVPRSLSVMSLGGRSHRSLARALNEFRRSAASHGLVGHWRGWYFFLRQWSAHVLLRFSAIRRAYICGRARLCSR